MLCLNTVLTIQEKLKIFWKEFPLNYLTEILELWYSNSLIKISSIRVVVKYLDYLNEPDVIRNYCRRLSAPLITLMGSENEIQFVVLKNINIIL
jgi:hypothetical protein